MTRLTAPSSGERPSRRAQPAPASRTPSRSMCAPWWPSPTSRQPTSAAASVRFSARLHIAICIGGGSNARCSCSVKPTAASPMSPLTSASQAWGHSIVGETPCSYRADHGRNAVGAIVGDVRCLSPRSPSTFGCSVRWGSSGGRAEGRRRLDRVAPEQLRPVHNWVAKHERAMNDRLDRLDDYLNEIQRQGERT